MESLLYFQADSAERINKAYVNYKKSPKDRISKEYCQSKLETLERVWEDFLTGHKELIHSVRPIDLTETDYVKQETYNITEESYINYKCMLKKRLNEFEEMDQAGSRNASVKSDPGLNQPKSLVKLPKIHIPMFSGRYTEWITFRDLFKSLVDGNDSLDNVQKLNYLKGYLSGEAEQLLRHIPIAGDNYMRCWELLSDRYDNKKYMSHNIIQRLLGQRNAITESASFLKGLIDTSSECLNALSAIGVDTKTWDILVIHILSLKLDPETRKQWELHVTSDIVEELPSFVQFKAFITNRFRALEFIEQRSNTVAKQSPVQFRPRTFHAATDEGSQTPQCRFCVTGNHKMYLCGKFMELEVDKRREFVRDNGICFACLGYDHSARYCRLPVKCKICRRHHHSLLHTTIGGAVRETETSMNTATAAMDQGESEEDTGEVVASNTASVKTSKSVLLATAVVQAKAKCGKYVAVRALLDQGSQASFITEATVQLLRLAKKPTQGQITGIGGSETINTTSLVLLELRSTVNPAVELQVKAYVLPSITTLLPSKKVIELSWLPSRYTLADPEYHTPNKINLLLGAEVYGQVLQEGIYKDSSGALVAQSTAFGWVISGVVETQAPGSNVMVMHTVTEEQDILKKFWELEAETQPERILTDEEKKCEELFEKTTRRDTEGRYIVRLPFKSDNPESKNGNSKQIAIKRYLSLEKRLVRNQKLKEEYEKTFREYLRLKYMEPVKKEDLHKPAVYLPYHEVIREDKETTKVRIVMNASMPYSNGVSLNDDLMVGPTLQSELRHLIMRWRTYPIVLVADIKKMYHQIKVDEEDANYQRIIWREEEGNLTEYKLLRVTFGTSSAPYLAVRCLMQVAIDEGHAYPLAANRVLQDYYMDDLLTGAHSVEEGVQIYSEMNELLGKAKFELQKWSSNNDELLNRLEKGKEREPGQELKIKTDLIMKILGLTWHRSADAFRYTVSLPETKKPETKRSIISDIAKLFDPLGWVAPTVIIAKMMIQKLWLAGVGWDDEAPKTILNEWKTYREELKDIEQIVVPRWLGISQEESQRELHGFGDASKGAYAAAVYLRVVDISGKVRVGLVTAKTKVAPVKPVSIPRLELCAAVMVTKLLKEVGRVLDIPKERQYGWTDSTTVLAWINSHPSRWKTFVANRVSTILNILDPHQWAHIASGQNPADAASRGLRPKDLVKSVLWFEGPELLKKIEIKYDRPKEIVTKLEEARVLHTTAGEEPLWERFSSFHRLIRVVAYCRRWLKMKNPKGERHETKSLSLEEIEKATEICIRQHQREEFRDVIKVLEKNEESQKKELKKNCKIRNLNPYIDEQKLLRVGGRLENASLTVNRKHPILMGKNGKLTQLLIEDAHKRTLHGGQQLMLGYLGTKYWVIGAKQLVKACVRRCAVCVRNAAVARRQLMGQLPSVRVTPSRPFSKSGVDYAGPINIRTSKGRGHRAYKGYICLFICMATKAIHLEVASDLTSQGYLAAFRRFVARRGHCGDLWSDNGTNFVGAARELKQLFDLETSNMVMEVRESLANNGTKWHFIPPRAPNFGGLWEAGIKSTKYHLKRIIGDSTLTFEEITTVLAQIEACLNSRPLSKVSDNPNDPTPLTPGHFLVGEPLVLAPQRRYEDENITNLRRWQLVQRMVQDFWRRWSREYLTQFHQRHKWASQTPEPQLGEVVLVMEDGLPPAKWLYGIITGKHTGSDGMTRVVSLRCKQTIIKRPVSKLCFLPVCN